MEAKTRRRLILQVLSASWRTSELVCKKVGIVRIYGQSHHIEALQNFPSLPRQGTHTPSNTGKCCLGGGAARGTAELPLLQPLK